jgi:hypothetical protein
MAQKQTGKGVAAVKTAPVNGAAPAIGAYRLPFSGGSIGPVRETDNLAETDAQRDRGVTFVTTTGVEGSPEFYVRDATLGFFLHAVLGTDTKTGTTPNWTHAITPAATLPYYTFWKGIDDTLFEQYVDCKVGSLTVSAEAGGLLTASAGINGLQASRSATDYITYTAGVPDIVLDADAPYSFNEATVALGTGGVGTPTTALVRSFELTIENNLSRQQTDDFIPYDVVEGVREISLSFDLIFENLQEYNKFHYGGAAGTAISNSVFTTDAIFTFSKGANNSIAFNLPSIAYEEFPVEPDAGGDPITASVRAVAQRVVLPSQILTATVKNQAGLY